MREEIGNLVFPVLSYGLRLKARLDGGESLNQQDEQATLKGLLGSASFARQYEDYGGSGVGNVSMLGGMSRGGGHQGGQQFLGIRYILACWLDEVFIDDSPWAVWWNENKLETDLYGILDRASQFWTQTKMAEARPGTDVLEVAYLCVMLGFRGDYRDRPEELAKWRGTVEARLNASQAKDPPSPPEGQVQTNVPPLRGRERMQKRILWLIVLLFLLIPLTVFLLVTRLANTN